MRISGGVLAIIVALCGAGCGPGRSAAPLPEGDTSHTALATTGATTGAAPEDMPEAGGASPAESSSGPWPGSMPWPGAAAAGGGVGAAASPSAVEQARRLTTRLDRYLRGRPGRASVAVYDRVTGMRYRYREGAPYRLGAVAEIDILLVLLLRSQERMRGLTPRERRLAARMIRFGDDRAARRLYAVIGGHKGLTRTLRQLGAARTRPGPDWKGTRSVAADQLRVLDMLTSPRGPVRERNRAFASALLASSSSARAHGVGAAADRRDRVALKTGWHRARKGRGGWTVASAGRIVSPSRDTLITVLSDRNPKRQTGRATVERVATMVMDEVRRD